MAAPATEELRELVRVLTVAAESGEMLSFAALRDETGLGNDDLQEALNMLREQGQAVMDAPGMWRGPTQTEMDAAAARGRGEESSERVRVTVPDREPDESLEADAQPTEARAAMMLGGFGPTVRLTRSIVAALDEAAVGAIVKVAVEQSEADEAFTLEVLP